MIDVKKFVVTFMILAVVASSLALALFGISGNDGSASVSANQPFTVQSSGTANNSLQGNAFAPSAAETADTNPADNITADTTSTDPNNLTDQLAASYLNNLVAANPDGLQSDSAGNQIMTAPAVGSILSGISTSSALQNLQIPDWDFDAATIPVRVASDTSDAAVGQYSLALSNILNNRFVTTNLESIVNDSSGGSNDQLSYVVSQIQSAIQDASAVTVPANMTDLHKSFIKLLVYEKNSLALTQTSSDDPVKSALIFQAENAKYQATIKDFQTAWQKAMQNKAFSLAAPATNTPARENTAVALINNILGIKEAHAQFGFGITFDPTLFGQIVWQFAQGVLLQILKNTLITELQNKVLNLIRNNGNPRFVQGFSTLLSNAFNTAAGSALGQIYPGLCGNFNTDVEGWLRSAMPTVAATPGGVTLNGAAGTQCTLQNTINNIPGYYNNFNTAGWAGFTSLLQPNNNPFGAFAEANDVARAVANAQSQAAQTNAIANNGSSGQGLCDDGSQPDPGDGNVCDDGTEPIKVTPGNSFMDTLNRNMNSNIDLIVNANDITGIVATIASALLQQLINNGVNGIMNGIQNAGTGATPVPPPPPVPVSCSPVTQVAAAGTVSYFGVSGGNGTSYTWTGGGNPATGSGQSFTTSFPFVGNYTVTVTGSTANGNQTATCAIQVQ